MEKLTEKEIEDFLKIKNINVYGYETFDMATGNSPYH